MQNVFTEQNFFYSIDEIAEYIFSDNIFEKTASTVALSMNTKLFDTNHMTLASLKNIIDTIDISNEDNFECFIYCLIAIENIYSCTHSNVPRQFLIDLIQSERIIKLENEFARNFICFVLCSIFTGSYDDELISTIVFYINESDKEIHSNCSFFLYLGLGLLLMNNTDDNDKKEYGEKILHNLETNPQIPKECYILCKALINRGRRNFDSFEEFYEKTLTEYNVETFDDSQEASSVHEGLFKFYIFIDKCFLSKE